ncbi:hypothetical protein DM01DRAFT_1404725 [Hesseltinella vesiculosa]|uniref:TH1 protein n=1 Tax=Hesseltinella vesiculosa TaxID=101127 RepID=A0A1X2GSN4_9FUNG|nr:hypothetical protein DM01DRAFT_1404725 [Hesseltinella vesiculosa]
MSMQDKLNDYKNALSQKDAILEHGIYTNVLADYLQQGGAPLDAVTLLAESYIGLPSMCNVLSSTTRSIGIDGDLVFRNAIKDKLKERFDPKRCDPLVKDMNSGDIPDWLLELIQDPYWRQTIYELLQEHPGSEFLNFVVLKISESGHKDEVAQLKTASTYLEVYTTILDAWVAKLVPLDDLEVDHQLPDFLRVCCEREETYFYAQVLLQKLLNNEGYQPFIRISKELEKTAMDRGHHAFVDVVKSYTSDAPTQVAGSIKAIRSNPTPGDVMTLYKLYTGSNPPAVHHLCDFDFIKTIVHATFVPKAGVVLKQDINDKLLYLLAYATTRNDTKPTQEQQSDITRAHLTLKELWSRLKEARGEDLTGAIQTILNAIKLPIGAFCVLQWIEYTSTQTPYFVTYFRSTEVPVLHLLLDEIACQHPLQRGFVFDVIKTCLLTPGDDSFVPEILMRLQKSWIDRLVYLVQLQYSLPVLQFMKQVERDVDDSLTVHFVQKVLRMAHGPYTLAFVEHMVDLLFPIKETLGLMTTVQLTVVQFLTEAQRQTNIDISAPLKEKIENICQKR